MKNEQPTIADRIRRLLARLGLSPQPKPLPQPIPVRTTRRRQ